MAITTQVVEFEFLKRPPMFTPREALRLANLMMKQKVTKCPHGKKVRRGCGHLIACNYGYASLGYLRAIEAWENMPAKYRHEGLEAMVAAPAGALLFWSGGTHAPGKLPSGHTGLSDGKGNILGNDLPTTGVMGLHPIRTVTDSFTLSKPEGWAFPYFAKAPKDNREPPRVGAATMNPVDRIIDLDQAAIHAARQALATATAAERKILKGIITDSKKHISLAQTLQHA